MTLPRRLIVPSLRRSLIGSALAVVVITTATMLIAFSITVALRREVDRDTNAFVAEQRIADQIVALTYQQQLEAYRFPDAPSAMRRARFQATGDEADTQMRRYLFHVLSPAARLQVERMKETHETFEVLAQRAFDLAERGETAAARSRLDALDTQTASLDTAVVRFLEARVAQHSNLQEQYSALTARVRVGLALVGLVLLALVALLVRHLRRQVVVPLEQLTAAAVQIRGGDVHARVPKQYHLELQQVARAFNEMADSVQFSRETVEMQNEELRQSLEQLHETQDELVQHEKLSAMGQMLAGLAHELNNPLGGVLGLAELLRAELTASPDAEVRRIGAELAAPLEREAIRARELVRSLLNFARKPTGVLEPVNLATTAGTAVGLCTHAFVQAGKQLRVHIDDALYVLADPQRLQHAVVNLVNNALDAILANDGRGLTITASREGIDRVRVDFDDDGPGFDDVEASFAPFYTTKPADKGTGLGLALVRKFIEECGGAVTATNREEGGARVTLFLRRAAAPATASAVSNGRTDERTPSPVSTSGREVGGVAARPRVLVVDDEPSLREVQRRLLILEGIDVLVASNGAEAREILARERIDLVVSDLRMPGDTDGLGLIGELMDYYPKLAESALLVTGDVSGGTDAPVPFPSERLIKKPFTRTEYIEKIRTALAADAG